MKQNIRDEDWREELYQAFHNMPSTVDARTEKFHEIAKMIDSHHNTTLKEIEEYLEDDNRITRVRDWMPTTYSEIELVKLAEKSLINDIKQLIHQKLIK